MGKRSKNHLDSKEQRHREESKGQEGKFPRATGRCNTVCGIQEVLNAAGP